VPYPHMPNGSTPVVPGPVRVTYVATGAEGTDFRVNIGTTMNNANYDVLWQPMGMAALPSIDLPDNAGDRTTTTFRVLTNGPLTAGDQIRFFLG
jgi:hypothetical protein